MNAADDFPHFNTRTGLLVDANLLVLLIVGSVNPNRITQFKRTSQYPRVDFERLIRLMEGFTPLYTLAHIMAEVSNLTGLIGGERIVARLKLKALLEQLEEPSLSSRQAAECSAFQRLGLTDAAIITAARHYKCTVLTSDFDLYYVLSSEGLPALDFVHFQAV